MHPLYFPSLILTRNDRDEYFSVSGVFESDVIHASKKDIPCIFRVTTSMVGDDGSQRFTQLFLGKKSCANYIALTNEFAIVLTVDRESEKNKWIDALHELHRIIRRNKLPNRNPLRVYPLMTSFQLPALRHPNNINCCCIIDVTRLLIGCEDCLICCDLDIHSYRRLTNSKKIVLCSYSSTDQLVVVLAGKQRHIKLIPTRGLDEDNIEWIKVTETKGATTFVIVPLPTDTFICVAIKKTLLIYQVNRKKTRYTFWREIQMPLNIQTLTCHDNMIAVGTNSNFVVYAVNNREQPPLYLVNQDCPQLSYLTQNSIDGFTCQSVSEKEWILVFARKLPYFLYLSCMHHLDFFFQTMECMWITMEEGLDRKSSCSLHSLYMCRQWMSTCHPLILQQSYCSPFHRHTLISMTCIQQSGFKPST